MALFNLDIQKAIDTEFWTNRYTLDLATADPEQADIQTILLAERNITTTSVSFTSYRLSTATVGDETFFIVPVGESGLYSGGGDRLPLFNCVRVDFTVLGTYPCRKYLRTGLTETMVAGLYLTPTYRDLVNANYADVLAGLSSYVNPAGRSITGGAAPEEIAMRQLRRGSRRRTQPVIPVA